MRFFRLRMARYHNVSKSGYMHISMETKYRYTDGGTPGDAGAQRKSKAIVWKMSDPTVLGKVRSGLGRCRYP